MTPIERCSIFIVPQIIDNIALKMQPVLQTALRTSVVFDASVGYFNLRGWSALLDAVDNLPGRSGRPTARLLIGMRQQTTQDELKEELRIVKRQDVMDNATAAKLKELAAADLRAQLCWGIPTAAQQQTLLGLKRQLESGHVNIKLFLRHNLHAKLYLCHFDNPIAPQVGFVGSSNLTFSGLGGQGELNVDVLDHDATKKLHRWFEDRWEDRFSVDISDELVKIIEESWAADRILDPYLIHLKLAFHLSREARAGLVEFGLPDSMQRQLLQFQAAAVKITARNLMERGGAILGDVVGLGKTIVATAIALLLQEEQGFETLIICPKNLVGMWMSYVERFRVHAKVVSSSTAHVDLVNLRRYRLVIVDESHNLRNHKTRIHAVVKDYVSLNDPKVLLLTATPYNTSMDDVANQLSLFIDEDRDLGIRPEAAILHAEEDGKENVFMRKCDDKPSTLKAFQLSEEDEDWQRLLALFLVRRTRKFIKDNYAILDPANNRHYLLFNNGDRNYLPDRIPLPLPFEASDNDPTSLMASESVLAVLDALKLPRYELVRYLDPRKSTPTQHEALIIADLEKAQGNLIGFTRTMLLKRLTSSGAVFMLSIQRHLLRNYMFLTAIESRSDLPIGTFHDSQIFSDNDDLLEIALDGADSDLRTSKEWKQTASKAYDEIKSRNSSAIKWIRSSLFTNDLKTEIEHDIALLLGILKDFGSWDEANDTKLDALQNLLEQTHPDEKVLVFSEYADTATYVVEALKRRGVARIASVTGDDEDPTKWARRFSPESNRELPGPVVESDDHIRVLVATDVLSEGQNLQDAAIVVNFDLPWAIIKLIQRAGRVDRIGQKSPKVLIYTFLPQGGIEEIIKLRARVARRLTRLARVFGADEKFLNTDGESQLIKGLFDESGHDFDADREEEVDAASAAYEIWRKAETDYPKLAEQAKNLPNVCFTTRAVPSASPDDKIGVLVYTLSEFGYDQLGFATQSGKSYQVSPQEALTRTACDPLEKGVKTLPQHFDLIKAVVEGPMRVDENSAVGRLSGARKRIFERVKSHLDQLPNQLFGPSAEVNEAVDALFRAPLTEQAKQALTRAMRERSTEDLIALLVVLHAENRLSIDTQSSDDQLHIVCSMGFVKRAQGK